MARGQGRMTCSMVCSVQCGGVCCRAFYLSCSRERLTELATHAREILEAVPQADDEHTQWARDTLVVDAMLIPLDSEGVRYTCNHFDWVNGLCSIYEQRPQMCREYPYRTDCEYCGYVAPAGQLVRWERAIEQELHKLRLPPAREKEVA